MNDLRATTGAPILDIAIPVYNEERVLEQSVRTLHAYVRDQIPFATRITVVDNASRDATRLIGLRLARELDGVRLVHLPGKGRGRALRTVWLASDARVVAYMDVDLSTRLLSAAGADCTDSLRECRHRHRQPARAGCAGDEKRGPGVHLAHLQPAPSWRAARELSGCAVRVQGRTCPGCARPGPHGS